MTTTLHTRVANFVNWIRPDPDTVDAAREQRDETRSVVVAAGS